MDVFVLGEPAGSGYEVTDPKWPISLQVIPTGVSTVSKFARSPWGNRLVEGEADFAAIVTGSDRETLLRAFLMAFELGDGLEGRRNAVHLMIDRIDSDMRIDPVRSAFASLRNILLAARAVHGSVVFRRSRFKEIGPLRPISDPVWDWVIRCAASGEKISTMEAPNDRKYPICRLPLLAPPRPTNESDWLLEHLTAFSAENPDATLPIKMRSKVDVIALRAGLFQWHDFLNESHELSQSIEGQGENQLGDYWHAIMHRREPDYSNAKYWFRQIGNQPTYRDLRQHADGILEKSNAAEAPPWRNRLTAGPKWDPFAFVDMCEECAADETSELAIAARRIQYAEMSLLM